MESKGLSSKIIEMYQSNKTLSKWLTILAINLLLSSILLFGYNGHYVECLLLPWIVYLLSFVGYIPFAGFLLFFWLFRVVVIGTVWTSFNLEPSVFTFALFWIYEAITVLRTLQATARIGSATLTPTTV